MLSVRAISRPFSRTVARVSSPSATSSTCSPASGAADTVSAVCFGDVGEIVQFVKDNPLKK